MMKRALLLALPLLLGMAAHPTLAATSPDEILEDPELEDRARALGKELRCLVCQNQAIDDSDADLARDLRLIVRERLVAGDSDQEIRDYMTARYGDFVLLKPPFNPGTALLWVGPFFILAAGGWLILRFLSTRPRLSEEAALAPRDQELAAELLKDSKPTSE